MKIKDIEHKHQTHSSIKFNSKKEQRHQTVRTLWTPRKNNQPVNQSSIQSSSSRQTWPSLPIRSDPFHFISIRFVQFNSNQSIRSNRSLGRFLFSSCMHVKSKKSQGCIRKAKRKKETATLSKSRYNVHAPSLPNSLVHSSFLFRSSWLTVGRELRTALMKSLITSGGSSSWSDSTSIQDISIAPASPGEQGVSFSAPSTITLQTVSLQLAWALVW